MHSLKTPVRRTLNFTPESPDTVTLLNIRPRPPPPTTEAGAPSCRVPTEAQTQSPPEKPKYASRSAEAKALLVKAKTLLGQSRNIRADIKSDVTAALERLYQLVKEGEDRKKGPKADVRTEPADDVEDGNRLTVVLSEHMRSIQEHTENMKDLKKALETRSNEEQAKPPPLSYAEATASQSTAGLRTSPRSTIHSVVVTSRNELETGEEVLNRIRQAVDAKEGWIKVERIRKAKDKKVILGFSSREERRKAKERLERDGSQLLVEEMKNKDPLLVFRDVLSENTDEDIQKAFRNQNDGVFHGLEEGEDRMTVKYRRRSKNPHTCHVVVSVSPSIWARTLKAGSVFIDLQRIRVEDQSPLIQCTRCLGFGHGRRFCKEPADLCSHCGGPHLNRDCAERLAEVPPNCRNCARAQIDKKAHNAFFLECPTRKKWDKLARSTVAYT